MALCIVSGNMQECWRSSLFICLEYGILSHGSPSLESSCFPSVGSLVYLCAVVSLLCSLVSNFQIGFFYLFIFLNEGILNH